MEILEKAQKMLENYPLCDHCLGRQFAFLGYGMGNQERGRAIKTVLAIMGHRLALSRDERGISLLKLLATNGALKMAREILKKLKRRVKEERRCFLCEGRFNGLPALLDKILKMLEGYEYETFLVGVKLPTEVEEREDEFKAEFKAQYGESIRSEFSRVIGKVISQVTCKPVDYMKPQLVVLVNPFTEEIKIQVNSLFIMGRYRKMVRNISQSKWICTKCRGEGCPRCNWTGKMYEESVEELIAEPILEKSLGVEASFHGAGREDVNARMLGEGRPFVVEIKKPRRRGIDLQEVERIINEKAHGKVEVSGLKFVDKKTVRKIKRLESAEKLYRVVVKFDRTVSDDEIERLERALTGITVIQQTPLRVLHRRPDRIREKQIYETKVKRLSQDSLEMEIRCQGGLYIKELVTGDEGRTDPSVSKIVNAKAEPLELDVLNIFIGGDEFNAKI